MIPSATSTESTVAQAVENLRTAILNADGSALDALAAEGLTYGHSNAHVDDRASFLEKLSGETPAFRSIAITEQSIIVSSATAVVRHRFAAETADGGTINLHHLLVWVEQNGTWKLLARQAVKLA
jgi:hypothetical protein